MSSTPPPAHTPTPLPHPGGVTRARRRQRGGHRHLRHRDCGNRLVRDCAQNSAGVTVALTSGDPIDIAQRAARSSRRHAGRWETGGRTGYCAATVLPDNADSGLRMQAVSLHRLQAKRRRDYSCQRQAAE